MSTVLAHLAPLADKIPQDNDVVAGWVGAVVFIGLIVAVALLGWSLSGHLKKVRTLRDDDESTPDTPPSR